MARNLNVVIFMVLTVANLLDGSVAQTKHVVGDATGWTIPSNGASFYVNWASNKTFTVGDTLVFNFANGQHDVAKVTKSDSDSCNGAKTISLLTNGPASVTLKETGQQYFICTFGTHCSLGQKLSINVVKKASTTSPPVSAPQPSSSSSPPKSSPVPAPSKAPALAPTQTPTATPAPAPSPADVSGGVNYTVGDINGWTIPANGASAYTTWASGKSFKVGDVLVFNFAFTTHNVEEVTKAKYDSCNSASPIATFSKPPVRITLNKTGTHYFICGFSGHCSAGQKLSINVGAKTISPATSPSPTAASPSPSADSPSSSSSTVNPSSQSPNTAVSPPPQNSAAVSVRVTGLFLTVLSLAAAFFC